MPHEQMTEQQVASYLHMDQRELNKLACRGSIPCRKVGGKFVFVKQDIDHWVESQMHTMAKSRLHGIEKGVSTHHGMDQHEELLICPLIPDRGAAVPLDARTRDAVIRGLVELAERAGLVYNKDHLVAETRNREELCTTAIAPDLAIPHPRQPLPYDIASSFVVVGLTSSGIPFGALDGTLTRLFFLICCKDERTHLHVLARLAQILHDRKVVEKLLAAKDEAELMDLLKRSEEAVLVSR